MKYTIVVVRHSRYYLIDLYEVVYIYQYKGIQLKNVSVNKHLLHRYNVVNSDAIRTEPRQFDICYYLDLLSINLVMLPSGNPAMIVKYTSTICLENVTILYR
jgi:hypothetical protein